MAALTLASIPAASAAPRPTQRPTQVVAGLGDAAAAARVVAARERRPDNAAANHRTPGAAQLAYFRAHDVSMPPRYLARIDGSYTGTTDEIIQWAAYKWGFDPQLLRAVAAVETWWHDSVNGDHGASFGLFQLRVPFHCCKAIALRSTAFDADYYGAILRSYYDGSQTWLNTVAGNGQPYTASDLWGSVGAWFSGRWHDAAAQRYVRKVARALATKPWLGRWF